jgi:transposase-like protein
MESSKQERMFALLASRDSDQSVSSFCQEQGIKEASFYYWQKKYREVNPEEQPARFAALEVTGAAGNLVATVHLPGGALITLYHAEAFSYIQPLL